jgi:hypothetical protein
VWISFADCSSVVFSCGEQVVVCHAGLKSMFDLENPHRWSVVRHALCKFTEAETS